MCIEIYSHCQATMRLVKLRYLYNVDHPMVSMVVEVEARAQEPEVPRAEMEGLLMDLAFGMELPPSVQGLGQPLSQHCRGKLVILIAGLLPGVWQDPCDTDQVFLGILWFVLGVFLNQVFMVLPVAVGRGTDGCG